MHYNSSPAAHLGGTVLSVSMATGAEHHSTAAWSTQNYFSLLREHAIAAGESGNYAIAASLVVREEGRELVCIGSNTLFEGRDPSGHAEMNAIRLARAVGDKEDEGEVQLRKALSAGALLVRRAPDDRPERILYTTLEPCPMCTVCVINAGVTRVVIAAEDVISAFMATPIPDQVGRLRSFAHAEENEQPCRPDQSTQPDDLDTYLAPALKDDLLKLFASSRIDLDDQLRRGGVLNGKEIVDASTKLEQVLPK